MKRVKAPADAQLLIFPMLDCTVAGGYKNERYEKDKKMVHYGVDFDSKRAVDFDVIASGSGTVLGVERNKNSIGGVVVIKYPKVFNPTTGKTQDLIARYYHFYSIAVKKGDKVEAYQKIGTESGRHKWWNHIHMELDTDTEYPFYTPQVKEGASDLLKRGNYSVFTLSKSIIDPITVLIIGKKQAAKVHSLAKHTDFVKDAPRFEEL